MDPMTEATPSYEVRHVVDGRCPDCRYDLRATLTLTGVTCPECGRALRFDEVRFPGDRSMTPLRRVRWIAMLIPMAVVLGIPALTLGVLVYAAAVTRAQVIGFLVTGAVFYGLGRLVLPAQPDLRRAWWAVALAGIAWFATPHEQLVSLLLFPLLLFARWGRGETAQR